VRLINSGLLDELPALKVQVSHFAGGIGRYLPRIRGLQQREKSGTATIPRHGRQPRKPFDHYLRNRLFYDCAGWSGPDYAAERGAEWVRIGMAELPVSQLVFATDYPQAVRHDNEVVAYVKAVGGLGSEARKILDDVNAEKLIPNLKERLARVQLNAGNGVLQLAGEQGAAISTPVDESQSVMQQQQQIQLKKDTTNK
jgi:hypothetical protein